MFIYFSERERERKRQSVSGGGAERQGDRGSEMSSSLTVASQMQGSNSRTVSLLPEVKSEAQPTEPPRCPSPSFLNSLLLSLLSISNHAFLISWYTCSCLFLGLSLPGVSHPTPSRSPSISSFLLKNDTLRGAWVAQSVKRPTSARSRSRGP